MTREHLQSLPLKELESMARREGLEINCSIDRQSLIEFLLEDFLEQRRQRELENSPSVRVEEAKYEIADDLPESSLAEAYPLPKSYNETRIVLMGRDPHWAFAYWGLEERKLSKLRRNPDLDQLILRVHDLQSGSSFDIPVDFTDASWYIYLPNHDCSYALELGAIIGGRYDALASSNSIHTPRESISAEAPPGEVESLEGPANPFFGYSSSGAPVSSGDIPQRILSVSRD